MTFVEYIDREEERVAGTYQRALDEMAALIGNFHPHGFDDRADQGARMAKTQVLDYIESLKTKTMPLNAA